MLGCNILFVGSVLLICSLAHCHHHSHKIDHSNRHAGRDAYGRVKRSTSQHTLRDQLLDVEKQIFEDQVPSRPSDEEDDGESSQRTLDRNEVDPGYYQENLREKSQEPRENQREQSSEDLRPSHPRFHVGHHKKNSQHKHQSVQVPQEEQYNPELESYDERLTNGDEAVKQTDLMVGESGFQQLPANERNLGEEENELSDESSNSEEQAHHYQGYTEYVGIGIYKFHPEDADSFDEANEICKTEGGHLAIAGSKEEADVFVTLWMKHRNVIQDDAYVGIHNRNPEGVFRTVFGNTLVSTGYLAWLAGEPDNKNGVEHCVSFYRYGGYRDISCNGPRPFICELRWKNEN